MHEAIVSVTCKTLVKAKEFCSGFSRKQVVRISRLLFFFYLSLGFGVERVEPLHHHHHLQKRRASKIPSCPSGKCRTLGNPFVIVEKLFLLVTQKSRAT